MLGGVEDITKNPTSNPTLQIKPIAPESIRV